MEFNHIAAWTFVSETSIPKDVAQMLVPGEEAIAAYKTIRDQAIFTTCQGPLSSAHRRPVFLPAGGHQNCPLVASWFARLGGGAGHRDGISSVA